MGKGIIAAAVIAVTTLGVFYFTGGKTAERFTTKEDSDSSSAVSSKETTPVTGSDEMLTNEYLPTPTTPVDQADSMPVASDHSEEAESEPTPEQREVTLKENLLKDDSLKKIADINMIQCKADTCSVDFEAKSDEAAGGLQMAVIRFLQTHPEYGTNFKIADSKDNPRLAQFTFSKEKLQ